MAEVFMVRLPGGEQYGPADAATLQSWFAEGRIRSDALILAPGAAEWRAISEAFDLTGWAAPAAPAAPAAHAAPSAPARPAGTSRSVAPRRTSPGPTKRGGTSAVWIAGGAIGVLFALLVILLGIRFLFRGTPSREAEVRSWDSRARTFSDPALGVDLKAPSGWILLRPESPLAFSPDAKVRLAQPSLPAFAFLRVDSIPTGIPSLEAYLDRVVDGRHRVLPDLKDLARSDLLVGTLRARQMTASWTGEEGGLQGAITVWQDGWDYFELEGWAPVSEAQAFAREFESLEKGFTIQGVLNARIGQVSSQVLTLAPQLSQAAAEMLTRDGLSRGQSSAEAIAQASFQVARRGFVALPPAELKEMGEIFKLVYAPLSEKERARLAAYLARTKGGVAEGGEDAEMREAMKSGILALPDDSRARLQAIFEKAIAAGLVAQ